MTLIAGLECADGLLICSDREESGGPSVKTSSRKVFDFSGCQFQLAIATAGDAALADKAVKRIADAARAAKFVDRHEELIEEVLRELYTTYVWPEEIPEGRDREIELIVGIYDIANQQQLLYRAVEEILWPKIDFVCAGSGEQLACYFLENLHSQTLTISEAMALMRFVLREVKDSSEGVGRESEMLAVTQSGTSRTLAADAPVPRLAECMTHFWETKPGTAKTAAVRQKIRPLKTSS